MRGLAYTQPFRNVSEYRCVCVRVRRYLLYAKLELAGREAPSVWSHVSESAFNPFAVEIALRGERVHVCTYAFARSVLRRCHSRGTAVKSTHPIHISFERLHFSLEKSCTYFQLIAKTYTRANIRLYV